MGKTIVKILYAVLAIGCLIWDCLAQTVMIGKWVTIVYLLLLAVYAALLIGYGATKKKKLIKAFWWLLLIPIVLAAVNVLVSLISLVVAWIRSLLAILLSH